VGWYTCYQWAIRISAYAAQPHLHPSLLTDHDPKDLLISPTLLAIRIQQTACAILAAMNAFWLSQIISSLFVRDHSAKVKGGASAAAKAREEEESYKKERSMSELDDHHEFPPATPRDEIKKHR
jgi:hypothetical protein